MFTTLVIGFDIGFLVAMLIVYIRDKKQTAKLKREFEEYGLTRKEEK